MDSEVSLAEDTFLMKILCAEIADAAPQLSSISCQLLNSNNSFIP